MSKVEIVDTIVCPRCSMELPVASAVCRRCGAQTSEAPLPREGRVLDQPWFILVLILHVGLLGIPVYWKTRYSLGVRLGIVLASIAYTVFAVGAILWIGAYVLRAFGIW